MNFYSIDIKADGDLADFLDPDRKPDLNKCIEMGEDEWAFFNESYLTKNRFPGWVTILANGTV